MHTEPSTEPVPEAPMERDERGALRPAGAGWFVLNVEDAVWSRDGYTAMTSFQGAEPFGQYGFNVDVLSPGQRSTSYHREYWEDESFFVLDGECLVLVEGQQRTMRAGDLFHAPAGTAHAFVGAGDGPCAMVTVGARNVAPEGATWGIYEHAPIAAAHDACVERDTSDPEVAYADNIEPEPVGPAWVPGARPTMQTAMLVRGAPADVFRVIADPELTSQIWFTESTGPLKPGASVRWTWGMYGGVWADVVVREFEPASRIVMEWAGEGEWPTTVEWTFEQYELGCMVRVVEQGFAGSRGQAVARAMDSMGGFSLVLAAVKAFVEHDVVLRVVHDRHPDAWSVAGEG
jgi:uncharacterized cupin superfamily protein/uncharacterized protein YndB with AHSA1/START domain